MTGLPGPQSGSIGLRAGATGTSWMVTTKGTSALRQVLPSMEAT